MARLIKRHDRWPGACLPTFFDQVRQRLIDQRLKLSPFLPSQIAHRFQHFRIDLRRELRTLLCGHWTSPSTRLSPYHDRSRNVHKTVRPHLATLRDTAAIGWQRAWTTAAHRKAARAIAPSVKPPKGGAPERVHLYMEKSFWVMLK